MIRFFIVVTALFLVLFLFSVPRGDLDSEYAAIDLLSNQHSAEVKERYGFHPIGKGGGHPCGTIRTTSIHYQHFSPASIEQARKEFLEIYMGFIEKMNGERSLRRIYSYFPVDPLQYKLTIWYSNLMSDEKANRKIASVFNFKDELIYRFHRSNPREPIKPDYEHEETLEEAFRIVYPDKPYPFKQRFLPWKEVEAG